MIRKEPTAISLPSASRKPPDIDNLVYDYTEDYERTEIIYLIQIAIPLHRCDQLSENCNLYSAHVIISSSQETLCRKNCEGWQKSQIEINQLLLCRRCLNHLVCLHCQREFIKLEKVSGGQELPNKNYYFVFTLSGHNVNGRPVDDPRTYRQTFTAKTQEQAERKLKSQYFKRVVVNIKSITCQ